MHQRFHDILRHSHQPPLWWDQGVPRFEPFKPELVPFSEAALVHTECQACGTVYIVAVSPREPLFHSLRDMIAFTNSLEVGDPPFACEELGAKQCWSGYCTTSLEIEILEFWHRRNVQFPWQREPELEKPLVDYRGEAPYEHPVHLRIYESEKRNVWTEARKKGDLSIMEDLLLEFGCERPAQVAKMLEIDRRHEIFRQEIAELRQGR